MDTVFLSLTKVHRGFLSFVAFAAADFCICLGVRAFLWSVDSASHVYDVSVCLLVMPSSGHCVYISAQACFHHFLQPVVNCFSVFKIRIAALKANSGTPSNDLVYWSWYDWITYEYSSSCGSTD